MNEIKVTTELCAEDRALLHNIHKVMTELSIEVRALRDVNAPVNIQMAEMPLDVMVASNGIGLGKVADTKEHEDFVEIIPEGTDLNDLTAAGTYKMETGPEAQPLPAASEEPAAPAAPQHTVAELQQKVINLVAGGADKKTVVATIIKQYAAKVTAVPKEKVDEVWAKLDELEG